MKHAEPKVMLISPITLHFRGDIPMCFAQGIVRPTNFSALRF